jgi:hypothetical protein
MTDFNVTIEDNFYDVRTDEGLIRYNLGVNYEIPTKSNQYTNLILDNISASFNGSSKVFGLFSNGDSYYPINSQQLIVVKDNLVMEPGVDYVVSQNNITFTVAPNSGNEVFIIALVTSADLTRTINFIVDSGSFDMTPGDKGRLTLDVSGQIESWRI